MYSVFLLLMMLLYEMLVTFLSYFILLTVLSFSFVIVAAASGTIHISKWPKHESPTSYTLPTPRIMERDPVHAWSLDVKEVWD